MREKDVARSQAGEIETRRGKRTRVRNFSRNNFEASGLLAHAHAERFSD